MNGPSARLSAVVVVVALGGVVGLAVAGRKPVAAPAPFAVEAAVASTQPSPTAQPTPTATNAVVALGNGLHFQTPVGLTWRPDQWPQGAPTPPPGHWHWVLGEDGIFGLPGYTWRATDTVVASETAAPPRHVFTWMQGGPGHSSRR